ncbi:protein phosphatase 2a, regulatory subunit, putative [Ricinus communis]|uniref:Protein phosphatase 2a, regulatory subunit, putative n=1 Tax=Ricinus communis TaxID=3988 RepID=B9S5I7_RICCO|nr:protein phosphatase 2a, regulatory subunit, putative [Ricinus communis]
MNVYRNSPKASPGRKSTTLQYLFELDSKNNNGVISSSPKTSKHSPSESENESILSTISHCSVIFTFTDSLESPSQQDFKRYKLIQLLSTVKSAKKPLPDQVAERALYIWNNEQFVKMASSAIKDVFPVIVEAMEKNLKWHWSKSVKQLTENVKGMLQEMDPNLYDKCLQEMVDKENLARQEEIKRKERWERIELEAAKNQFLQPQQFLCLSH